MSNADEESGGIRQLPSADRVARRALALAAMTCRVDVEYQLDAEFRGLLLTWLDRSTIRDELEAEEARIIDAPLGTLSQQDIANASWRSEGLAVLALALHQIDFPAHDHQLQAATLALPMGFLEDHPTILSAPRLRDADALTSCAERMFAIHWRLRQFSLDGQPMDFATFARTAWFGPLNVSGLPFVELDLGIGGVSLAKSPEWRQVLSIAMERHQAANWLVGADPTYSAVGTDT